MDRWMAASLDRWLTSPPEDYESNDLACDCGWEGRVDPIKVEQKEQTEHCDGKILEYVARYDDSPSVIQILGDEYRGRTYPVQVAPCESSQVTMQDHESHDEVVWAWDEVTWKCPECEQEHVEVDA